ncbi:MAG: sulfurtransferase TusA family protein [Candidatus Methanomethylophilaceae archaeon]
MVDVLDCKGLMCPMPVVQLAKKIKAMEIGQELELVSDDVGSKEDIPAWCQRTGNQLIGTEESGKNYTYRIKKLK